MTAPLGIKQPDEIRSFFPVSAHPLRQCEKCGLAHSGILGRRKQAPAAPAVGGAFLCSERPAAMRDRIVRAYPSVTKKLKVWARLRVAGVRILAPLQVPSADGPQARVRRPGSGLPHLSQARAQSERPRCDAGRADPFQNPAQLSATLLTAWRDPPASNPAARARHGIAQE